MRIAFSIIFLLLIIGLGICHKKAMRSRKHIGPAVAAMVGALIPPVIGNLIIISSTDRTLSTIGCYIYFLGMDVVMYTLLRFTMEYCGISKKGRKYNIIAYALLAVDALQLLCNPFFGHAFSTEAVVVAGGDYYRLIPYLGQTFHRVVDYGILAAVIIIFIVKMIRCPRIDSERYSVILATMIVISGWETAYIFSRTPVDRAMIGFGVFGLLVYYLSLYYRPMRLLDSMLAKMASELPEALFFFDSENHCIWANSPGIALIGAEEDNYDPVPDRLRALFGNGGQDVSGQREVTIGGAARSFVLESHNVTDDRGRAVGSFLSVRENTIEQETLQREMYKATHDSLTSLYNRAGYDLLLSRLELKSTYLLLIDADNFKTVNDTYGHDMGDRILQKIANTIKRNFRAEDYICRIGGDEFVVFMNHAGTQQKQLIVSRISRINAELSDTGDGLPAVSVSVGIAHGGEIKDQAELFEHADHALYETKRRGKNGYTFYENGQYGV